MSSKTVMLDSKKKITPPRWLSDNLCYETIMGSQAYGVSSDKSDLDLYGFCLPPKEIIFPHLTGYIPGFGTPLEKFEQFQQHHIKFNDVEYDISIYNIVKYFQLLMENNPNVVDSIFTPSNCVTHSTEVGNMVRNSRRIFLHKGAAYKYKGYAFSQLHKIEIKNPENSVRKEMVELFGYDVKFAYHLVRLLDECIQILSTGDLDLQLNNEKLKSIRRGEWSLEEIKEFFYKKEKEIESLYITSLLPYKPDEDKIKSLLLDCLEHHYGNLSSAVINTDKAVSYLREISDVINRWNND